MYGMRGSFLGFTYNNIHSSVLGITRTISSGMDSKKLGPNIKDSSQAKPNGDGEYFFGTNYTNRTFEVSFAFEEITESQLRLIAQKWNDKQIHELIFDEEPYKVYSAKITGMATLKTLSFSSDTERAYRGEGTINFTCYFPFAQSRYEYQEEYITYSTREWVSDENQKDYNVLSYKKEDTVPINSGFDFGGEMEVNSGYSDDNLNEPLVLIDANTEYVNKNEWLAASRIPEMRKVGWSQDKQFYLLYNAGDISISPKIYFLLSDIQQNLSISLEEDLTNELHILKTIPKDKNQTADVYLLVDFENQTLFGCDVDFNITGNLYNEYLTKRNFFEIQPGEQRLYMNIKPYKVVFKYLYL